MATTVSYLLYGANGAEGRVRAIYIVTIPWKLAHLPAAPV